MTNRLEGIMDWETEEELDDLEELKDHDAEWGKEEEHEPEDGELVQEEVKSYGRKLTEEERIQRFFDKYENMEPLPLMEGLHLYRQVNHAHVLELVPDLEKDSKIFNSVYSSLTDERLHRAMLRLFANPYYQKAHEEYQNIRYFADTPYSFKGLDRVVELLEKFRRFTLTAKRFVKHHELKTGDILLDGSIIVVMQGQPFRLRQGGGFSEGRFHFSETRSHHAPFVIGYSPNLDVEKIQQKWVQRTHADSLDGWMQALKTISQQFPSDSNGRPGFQVYRQVQAKYIDWYFANPEKVTEYYRKKNGRKAMLLSDLPSWLKKQVIDKMCEKNPRSLKRDTKIVWRGKSYCLPSLMTYVESPINDILENKDEKRIYKIDFALDSWYEWDTRTDITLLGEQPISTVQMDLFEESLVSPTETEQMSFF